MARGASGVCALALLGAALVAIVSGCTRAETAADRHLAEMRETISRMQLDRDRMDHRLDVLEVAMAEEKRPVDGTASSPPPPKKEPATPAPPPRVVQLGGENDEAPDPNDPASRPEIRLSGSAGGASTRSARSYVPEGGPAKASVLDPEAKKTYEHGLSQVQGRQYDHGLETLAAFLVRWPDHPYAENAMFWRGEAYFGKGDYAKAVEQFEAVLSRFGGGAKSPDALLKLGSCHEKLGAPARAQEMWDRLKNEYPKSDAAKRIPSAKARAADSDDRKGPKESR